VGMVAFVVDGSNKLLKYFLIRNTFLHQHEIKLEYFHWTSCFILSCSLNSIVSDQVDSQGQR
jgi:hypothetical protein